MRAAPAVLLTLVLLTTFSAEAKTPRPCVVPEPGTALLLGLGMAGLAISGRRKRHVGAR